MTENLQALVKEKYGRVARQVSSDASLPSECCSTACCSTACCSDGQDPITSRLYSGSEIAEVPAEAACASLGCGNPTALAGLKPGETVLDLGSGGGIDVLLAAHRVGPSGMVYGLDMTDDMLTLAEENKRKSGLRNVSFVKGEIERLPFPDNSMDVVISNCVINLSGNKDRVIAEIYRVLKPGGRLAISDVVVRGEVPEEVRNSMLLWVGCIAGALRDADYQEKLREVGFADITLETTRIYDIHDARAFLADQGLNVDEIAPQVEGKFTSAFIRATRPVHT